MQCRDGSMKRTIGVLFAVVIGGCSLPQALQHSATSDRPLTRADVRDAQEITVTVGQCCAPSASWDSFRCVFRVNGRCYGEATHYQEMAGPERSSKSVHEFPPETFGQVKKILLESRFLN